MATEQKAKLTPPDKKQCQCMITTTLGFMQCGGKPRTTERCKNKPTTIAKEDRPGADGLKGSMSTCDDCLGNLKKQQPTGLTYTPIKQSITAAKNVNKPAEEK